MLWTDLLCFSAILGVFGFLLRPSSLPSNNSRIGLSFPILSRGRISLRILMAAIAFPSIG
jgi:hypothetical protein